MEVPASQPVELIPSWVGLRAMFYLVSTNESSFEHAEDVPDYITQANPFFYSMLILEFFILWMQGGKVTRINDGISSITAGIISQIPRIFATDILFWTYVKFYERFNIVTLPWDSAWTWWLMFFGFDFAYYMFHRYAHEVNLLWGAHQTHHSSEDYNLTTALRQTFFEGYASWIFYVPLALCVPPTEFMVHSQLNLLYQFWIHTQVVGKLGPLEYILNTPSHHRVHHGRNRYCIDKNYGGTLIIWDRMFGTFEEEKEEVVYGLVHPINTWDPFYAQICHYKYVFETCWKTPGLWNKLSVLFNGPGWEPGKPRLGNIEDIPDIHAPQSRYDPTVSGWRTFYTCLHFLVASVFYTLLASNSTGFTQTTVLVCTVYLIWSLYNIGVLGDCKPSAPYLELVRCLAFFGLAYYLTSLYQLNHHAVFIMCGFFACSAVFAAGMCFLSKNDSRVGEKND